MRIDKNGLYLGNIQLRRPGNYVHATVGYFFGTTQKLVLGSQTHLELYEVEESGSMRRLASKDMDYHITQLCGLKLDGCATEYLVMLTDDGDVKIMHFEQQNADVKLVLNHEIALMRSGFRRTSPLHYLSLDPHSRCLVASALEVNKFCIPLALNNGEIVAGSPLVLSTSPGLITIDLVACYSSYSDPCFAALELETTENNMNLVYYMMDLNLNRFVKRASYKLHDSASFLIAVPDLSRYGITTSIDAESVQDGFINPFVVVGLDDYLLVKDICGYFSLKVRIPKRSADSNTKVRIIAGTLERLNKDFFMLLQSNFGDLYKLMIKPNTNDRSRPIVKVAFFDTLVPCEQLCVFKNGLMFANTELGNSYLLQFEGLGDDIDDESMTSSADTTKMTYFEPNQGETKNLTPLVNKGNINPALCSLVVKENPLTLNIAQYNGQVCQLTHGLRYTENIDSKLPLGVQNIWTVRLYGTYKLLVLSFKNKTLMILQIEDDSMAELPISDGSDAFIMKNDATLKVSTMGESSIIQVCETEFRQIRLNTNKKYEVKLSWFPPAGVTIISSSSSKTQLCLALSNHELVYFEMNLGNESLNELQIRPELDSKISALSLGQESDHRSDFLAVTTSEKILKIFSLRREKDTFLEMISFQVIDELAVSLQLVHWKNKISLHLGMDSGIYMLKKLDPVSADIEGVVTKFLGNKSVHLSVLNNMDVTHDQLEEQDEELGIEPIVNTDQLLEPCVVLHCTMTWMSYIKNQRLSIKPLILPQNAIHLATMPFITTGMPKNGSCSITASGDLSIGVTTGFLDDMDWFQTDTIGLHEPELSNESEGPVEEDPALRIHELQYMGRRLLSINENNVVCIENSIITGNNTSPNMRIGIMNKSSKPMQHDQKSDMIEIPHHCVDAIVTKFKTSKTYLIVLTTDNVILTIKVEINKRLKSFKYQIMHKTPLPEKAHCLENFQDKVLVPMACQVILYDLGSTQLLKRSVTDLSTLTLTNITTCVADDEGKFRIAIGDNKESVVLLKYDPDNNLFIPLVDDIVKRQVVALQFLDYNTVIGSDRFGNIFVLRVPQKWVPHLDDESWETLQSIKKRDNEQGPVNLNECVCHWEMTNQAYTGDIVVRLQVVRRDSPRPLVIYVGLQGSVGALLPLVTEPEIKSRKWKSVSKLKAYYNPSKAVADCDRREPGSGDDELMLAI